MRFTRLRRHFLLGIATVLPVGLTIFVIWFFVSGLGRLFRPILVWLPWIGRLPPSITTIIGFVLALTVITLIGALASGFIGRRLITGIDRLIQQVPLARSVYTSARQLTEAVFIKRSSLRKTVIVQYPRPGLFAIGFITSEEPLQLKDGTRAYLVFFPTAPNPTSGWLAIVPESEIIETGLSIEEGLKFVVSGGLARPAHLPPL